MSTTKGMSNPLALATATQLANSKQGQNAIAQTGNAIKLLFIVGGGYLLLSQGWNQFKKIRAKNFANENIGNPNAQAAGFIYESFTRVGFANGFVLPKIFPQITVATDEANLYKVASQITDIKAVAEAYKILFDRNLFEDIREGTSNKEAQKIYTILNSKSHNTDTTSMYAINDALYSVVKAKQIQVNIAEKNSSGKWVGTKKLYGNFNNGDFVGYVIANGVWTHKDGTKENYYIVEQSNWQMVRDGALTDKRRTGVVLQHQVNNIEP